VARLRSLFENPLQKYKISIQFLSAADLWVDVCVGVLLICVLVFTGFCIVVICFVLYCVLYCTCFALLYCVLFCCTVFCIVILCFVLLYCVLYCYTVFCIVVLCFVLLYCVLYCFVYAYLSLIVSSVLVLGLLPPSDNFIPVSNNIINNNNNNNNNNTFVLC
jgi:hypothetical protein